MGEEARHAPGGGRTGQQQGRQIGEHFLVPGGIDLGQQRVAGVAEHPAQHGGPVLLPDAQVGLQVMGDLVQEHRLPRIVPVERDADQRERIGLAQQAIEHDAAAERRRRIAVLHIGDRLQHRPAELPGRALPDRPVAIGGDDVVGGEHRRVAGAALAEHFEEQPEGAPGPVDLAFDQRDVDQQALIGCGVGLGLHPRHPFGNLLIDLGQPPVGDPEMCRTGGVRQVLRADADGSVIHPRQPPRPRGECQDLRAEKASRFHDGAPSASRCRGGVRAA